MTLDLYSYGRSTHRKSFAESQDRSGLSTFVCAGCDCSATAADPELILTIGWKLLPVHADDVDLPALCPRCSRRSTSRSRDLG